MIRNKQLNLTLIPDLNESKQYRSKSALRHVNARDIANHAYMDLLALWILYNEYGFTDAAMQYAADTIAFNGFRMYKQSSTDLYMSLHILTQKRVDLLGNNAEDTALLDKMYLDVSALRRYLRKMAYNSLSIGEARQILQSIEPGFFIDNSNYRSIRRLVQSWTTIDTARKRLAITRMLMFYRRHARRSEMYKLMRDLAAEKKLELTNVNDPEKGMSTIAKIATAGAAGYAGYQLGKSIMNGLF